MFTKTIEYYDLMYSFKHYDEEANKIRALIRQEHPAPSTVLDVACGTGEHVAAVGRWVSTLCKGEEGLHQQLALYQTYYNFCLPHASLRQTLPQPEPTTGTGSAKR